ncbi:hypothetical protein IVB22_19240 [Bradyrhizobium sp. 190]|uniref:hypothetical protein n=1 Tax=Bradyrhizobium sp. 190 TaxID=2782658 RepID=UPI001FFBEE93|nr:hypothetical protein [Bradyrhizobium sp. 190]MCK1514659.1 hypothetical protein [Bradyrhizobium sp. 190]
MGRPLLQGACCFIFASYTAHQLVGISVGIGNNRRQKFLQIQMVMALGGIGQGQIAAMKAQENSSSWFATSAIGIEPPAPAGIELQCLAASAHRPNRELPSAPEMTSLKRNKRDRTRTKPQQNQRS